MHIILKLFFSLPLFFVHTLGCILGLFMYLFDAKFRHRISNNLSKAKLNSLNKNNKLIISNTMHVGMTLLESFVIWFASPEKIRSMVKKTINWNLVNKLTKKNKGIIFLTPHMGSFEITAQYFGLESPIKVMFKPNSIKWLNRIIYNGRNKNYVSPVDISAGGIKQILIALKKGEAVGILPDQVPPLGHGKWSNFFGQKVYTMTLIEKLHKLTNSPILFAFGRRKIGHGFEIELFEYTDEVSVVNIDKFIEKIVRLNPEQYLWNYRRYKLPKS